MNPHTSRRESRMMQLLTLVEDSLAEDNQAQRARVSLKPQIFIPLTPRIRLAEADPSTVSMQAMYDDYCLRKGMQPDALTVTAQQYLSSMQNPLPLNPTQEQLNAYSAERLAIHDKMCSLIHSDVLSRYFDVSLPGNSEATWSYKRSLALQLGVLNALCYIFAIGDRTPQRFHFSLQTGRLFCTELVPGYLATGELQQSEDVPFRFSRSMHTFLFLMLGAIKTSMAATFNALYVRASMLQPFVNLYLRDDMSSWRLLKVISKTDAEYHEQERELHQHVNSNTLHAFKRISSSAPVPHPPSQLCDQRVKELFDAAMNKTSQSRMSTEWMAWF